MRKFFFVFFFVFFKIKINQHFVCFDFNCLHAFNVLLLLKFVQRRYRFSIISFLARFRFRINSFLHSRILKLYSNFSLINLYSLFVVINLILSQTSRFTKIKFQNSLQRNQSNRNFCYNARIFIIIFSLDKNKKFNITTTI